MADTALRNYLDPLGGHKIDSLILGYAHYSRLKRHIRSLLGVGVSVISQDEVVPVKLELHLMSHSKTNKMPSRHATIQLLVTELTPLYRKVITKWFGTSKLTVIAL